MFRISRANLVGAVAGFLLYAVFSSVINHLTSTQHISVSAFLQIICLCKCNVSLLVDTN